MGDREKEKDRNRNRIRESVNHKDNINTLNKQTDRQAKKGK